MNISNYADLLTAARQQPEPQRLLFVFTQPELPEGYTAAQNKGFEDGTGGVLTPQMCTDKALDELGDFADLVEESRHMGQDWKIVFVACLAGHAGGGCRVPKKRRTSKRWSIPSRMARSQTTWPTTATAIWFSFPEQARGIAPLFGSAVAQRRAPNAVRRAWVQVP
jgi:hypothetical protein